MNGLFRLGVILICYPLFAELKVDGQLDEPAWAEAQVFDAFTTTQPLTLDKPTYLTRTLMLSTKEGLYFGFINEHPNQVSRTRIKKARDQDLEADRNSVMIDFQNQGKAAYEFTVSLANSIQDGVIVDQKRFSYDWDGFWQHAVSETETHWYSEIFIPWSAVPMADADGDKRQISVYFTRVVHEIGERYAFPEASWERPTFVSDFHRVEVPNFKSSVFSIFPYATASHDALGDENDATGGLDLFWKPNGNHQFALTANPDFGQVESDDLVVNFTAIETFFSEKRSFFTENQALFDLDTTNNGRLIHTRRIGAAPDGGNGGATDIIAALKYSGSAGRFDFGTFTAAEDESGDLDGRDFYAGRVRYNGSHLSIGLLNTYTDRPVLERDARVSALDYELKPKQGLLFRGQVIDTDVADPSSDARGFGAWLSGDWQPSDLYEYRMRLSHYDDEYDINDMGFMSRNNFEEGVLGMSRRQRHFVADSHKLAQDIHFDAYLRRNTDGETLPGVFEFQYIETYKSTAKLIIALEYETTGLDDLITRGGNPVRYPGQMKYFISWGSPALGKFRYYGYLFVEPENLDDYAWEVAPKLSFFFNDNFNLALDTSYREGREWLIWQGDNRMGSFAHESWSATINLNWFPNKRQEVRLKFQWVGVDAEGRDSYVATSDGSLLKDDGPVDDFILSNSGLQVRYRYMLGPLTDIFAVYSRGSNLYEERDPVGFSHLFSEGWTEKTADQFLLKARYRF